MDEPEKQNNKKRILPKYFIIMVGIILIAKTLFFYQNTIRIDYAESPITLIGTIAFIITLCCIINILPEKTKIPLSIFMDIIISTILWGDNVYYIYSSNFLSVEQMSNLQYGNEIARALPSLLKWNQILYFIDFIGVIPLATSNRKWNDEKEISSRKIVISKIISGAIALTIILTIDKYLINEGQNAMWNKNEFITKKTIYGYHIYDIFNSVNNKKLVAYANKEEMENEYKKLMEEYKNQYGEEKVNLEKVVEGKNVLMVQLESMQEFLIDKQINGKEITPNLNRFLKENIEFKQMHMQSYSTTADSELAAITSTYPLENGVVFSKYFANKYDDIFELFHNANYQTSYMHGNYGSFWNRKNVYGRMKIDNVVFMDNFEDTSETIESFLSDELFYKQGVKKLKEWQEKSQKPFFSLMVAASSHTPFHLQGLEDSSKMNIDVGEYKEGNFGNYLEAANYADYAFGKLIESLKEENLYDDTVIVVFGDHNGLEMYNENLQEYLKTYNPDLKSLDLNINYTEVICGIKIPGITHIEIEKPVSKLDVKPTLSYLCGIEDGFSLGTNMFESKDFVCLNNGIIITDKYYYDGMDWFKRDTGEKIMKEELPKEEKEKLEKYIENMEKELNISASIQINNLLK